MQGARMPGPLHFVEPRPRRPVAGRPPVRSAAISEAYNTLLEMKIVAWAYYLQYGAWSGIDSTNFNTTKGAWT